MRGEQLFAPAQESPMKGSPPHARGAEARQAAIRCAPGITPACAGSSALASPAIPVPEDHPRMRGEQGSMIVQILSGSRITPACAGSSDKEDLR